MHDTNIANGEWVGYALGIGMSIAIGAITAQISVGNVTYAQILAWIGYIALAAFTLGLVGLGILGYFIWQEMMGDDEPVPQTLTRNERIAIGGAIALSLLARALGFS